MAVWPALGMNYGHQYPHNPYDSAEVNGDLAFLKSVGVTKLRIAFPSFDDTSGTLTATQGLVQTALGQGFYVIWGVVSSGQSKTTATRWASFKSYVTGTLAPWAQSLASNKLELSIGNEEELHCDGTTLTSSTVISDMASLATTVKGIYTYGPVSYQSPIPFLSAWSSNGIGGLDRIGFNAYSLGPVGISSHANNVLAAFPTTGYLSEWGTPSGYNDFNNADRWCDVMCNQVTALKATAITDAYYFCYRDGSFGLPADAWAIRKADDNLRTCAPMLFGRRAWFTGEPNVLIARGQTPNRGTTPARIAAPGRTVI